MKTLNPVKSVNYVKIVEAAMEEVKKGFANGLEVGHLHAHTANNNLVGLLGKGEILKMTLDKNRVNYKRLLDELMVTVEEARLAKLDVSLAASHVESNCYTGLKGKINNLKMTLDTNRVNHDELMTTVKAACLAKLDKSDVNLATNHIEGNCYTA